MSYLNLNNIYQTHILPFLQEHLLSTLGILVVAIIVNKTLHIFLEKLIRRLIRGDKFLSKEAEMKREDTLIVVFDTTLRIVVWGIASMMILSELGVNIGPLIAAAGVAGLAFGFGGQYIIKDVLSGFFILLENQYRVGDTVCIKDKCGVVESINLRLTVLRDMDGVTHHIPNGEINIASNMSKDFSKINLNVGVSYDVDLEKVIKVVNEVGMSLVEDEDWKHKIIAAPQFLRVNDFADSSVMIKITGEVQPGTQWEVTGELRKRLKISFDKNDIEIPYPQRVIHTKK